jgi:hypothetical protein
MLYNPSSPGSPSQRKETQAAAQMLGLRLRLLKASSPNDAMAREGAEALITLPEAMFYSQHVCIVELTVQSRLPARMRCSESWKGLPEAVKSCSSE